MQAGTTTSHTRASDIAAWLGAGLGVALLLLLLLSFVLEKRPGPAAIPGAALTGRIAYFEFGATADTLWLASAADLSRREKALSVPHAREFGAVPSMSPDGRSLAYTSLPPQISSPGPDSPAGLWLAPLERGSQPRLLASDADLLVAPVWSSDGSTIVYRRSDAAGYALVGLPVAGGEERVLAPSESGTALFPVGFSGDGSRFYHAGLSAAGSVLYATDLATAEQTEVAVLSAGLTRDWRLSRDGSRLAFLSLSFAPEAVTSRAYLLDLATATIEPLTDASASAFGPVWGDKYTLVVGTAGGSDGSRLLRSEGSAVTDLPGPANGFDVPLALSPDGRAYLVRAFSGDSAASPGTATLTLIDEKGGRHVIARGDVTFVGWSKY